MMITATRAMIHPHILERAGPGVGSGVTLDCVSSVISPNLAISMRALRVSRNASGRTPPFSSHRANAPEPRSPYGCAQTRQR